MPTSDDLCDLDVLIVEDDEPLTEVLKCCLESDGFQVRVALDAEDGFAKLKSQRPDVMILDVMLGDVGENAYDLVRKLREDSTLSDIPLIIYSGLDLSPKEKTELTAAGPTRFLIKTEKDLAYLLKNAREIATQAK